MGFRDDLQFWQTFPCPPPWNKDLFFQVNWTHCLGVHTGCEVQHAVAKRCDITVNDVQECNEIHLTGATKSLEACNRECRLIIGFVVVIVVAVVGASYFVCK